MDYIIKTYLVDQMLFYVNIKQSYLFMDVSGTDIKVVNILLSQNTNEMVDK